jgi:hypothetical protein
MCDASDDDVYFKKITARVSQNLILHKKGRPAKGISKRVNIQIL